MARRGRKPCCEKVGLNKGSWTPEEDLRLIAYISKHGHGNWRALPKLAGLLRCGKSCRLRWINYLRPDIKRGNFSGEEEETIIRLHQLLGNKWSKIAACLPGRTDNEIKNVWNTHLKKRLKPASPAADEKGEDSQASSSPSSSADGSSLDLIDLPMEMIDMDIWTPPPPPSQQVSPSSSSSELSRIVGEDRREQPLLVSTTSAERFLLEDEAELGEGINDSAWLEYLEKELGLCAATESNQVGEAKNGDGRMEAWDFEVAEEEEDPVSCYFQRELNFTSSPLRLT